MHERLTIVDPGAVPAAERVALGADWAAFGVSVVVMVLTSVVAYMVVRRRMRALPTQIATDALIRRMRLDRRARRGLAMLVSAVGGEIGPAAFVLNPSLLVSAAQEHGRRVSGSQRKDLDHLLAGIGAAPISEARGNARRLRRWRRGGS